jgi:hypothetical protein
MDIRKLHMKSGSFRDSIDVNNVPVQVVYHNEDGSWASDWFENFAAALVKFPTLDIYHGTKGFTWSMRGQHADGRTALRFESTEAYDILSR